MPGAKVDSKSWKEMEGGEEKRAAFLREMEPPLRPAPPSRIARKTKIVVGANLLLLAIVVVGSLLCAGR